MTVASWPSLKSSVQRRTKRSRNLYVPSTTGLYFEQPPSYISLNAQNDPEGWQKSLRQLIAADPVRVRAIMEAAERATKGRRP